MNAPELSADSRLMRAVSLQQQGKLREASDLFREELRFNPMSFAALYSMSAIENKRGEHAKALQYVDRALRVMPSYALAHQAKAIILAALGRNQEAALSLDNARRCADSEPQQAPQALPQPRLLEVSHPKQRLAMEAQSRGDMAGAKRLFEEVLFDLPSDMLSLYSLMVMASQAGKPWDALQLIERGLAAMPDYPPAHFARGTILQSLGLFDEALQALDQAILLQPDYLEALNNRASLLQALNKIPEAFLSLQQALRYKPDDEKLLMNTGVILTTLKRNADAVRVFDQLMAINPEYDYAQGYRLFAKLHSCDWSHYEAERDRIVEGLKAGKRLVNPLALFAMSDDPIANLRCAQMFTEHRFAPSKSPLWRGERYKHNKIRVGYLSPDLREHPVGHLMSGVIEHHDKTRFETYAFSLGIDDGSSLRRRFKLGFDHFIDCKEKTATEIASLIRAAEIDVLVDLAGYTAGSKSEIFAMRPAPAHVNFLGYPGTMGASWMDYLIADPVVIPAGSERFYQEKVLRLPHCYLPADDSIQIAARKPSRAECGLPDEGYVFCSFNHDYKINPPMWSVWMDLLRENPKSVLWLMKLNDDAIGNLHAAADRYGVDPKRLVFATRVQGIEDHLARYLQADLFLDTTPYNAHSTATDVLRTGLPILTLSGQTFAARVARSVIQSANPALGLLANDIDDYGRLARQQMGRARPSPTESHYPSSLQQAEALEELYAQIARETAQGEAQGGIEARALGGIQGGTLGGVQGTQAA